MQRTYYVYIMASRSHTLYIGMTNDLQRRVSQHKLGTINGFSKRYRITSLVYFEETSDVIAAITREKQLKGWLRHRKIELIEATNPHWRDLSRDWQSETR